MIRHLLGHLAYAAIGLGYALMLVCTVATWVLRRGECAACRFANDTDDEVA